MNILYEYLYSILYFFIQITQSNHTTRKPLSCMSCSLWIWKIAFAKIILILMYNKRSSNYTIFTQQRYLIIFSFQSESLRLILNLRSIRTWVLKWAFVEQKSSKLDRTCLALEKITTLIKVSQIQRLPI